MSSCPSSNRLISLSKVDVSYVRNPLVYRSTGSLRLAAGSRYIAEGLLLPSIFTRCRKKTKRIKSPAGDVPAEGETLKYPEVLPILPLRGVVVYPQTAVPLTIGQMRRSSWWTKCRSHRGNWSAWWRRATRISKNPARRICMRWARLRPSTNFSVSRITPSACWYRVWRVSAWSSLSRPIRISRPRSRSFLRRSRPGWRLMPWPVPPATSSSRFRG